MVGRSLRNRYKKMPQGFILKEVDSVTISELNAFKDDTAGYIRYLLRIDAYKVMADMSRDLGVSDSYVRVIKHKGDENA